MKLMIGALMFILISFCTATSMKSNITEKVHPRPPPKVKLRKLNNMQFVIPIGRSRYLIDCRRPCQKLSPHRYRIKNCFGNTGKIVCHFCRVRQRCRPQMNIFS